MNLKQFQGMAVNLAAIAWPNEQDDPGRLDAELGDKLSEEVGELAKVCRRHRGHRTHWWGAQQTTDDEVLDEVGDVLFVLARRAAVHGIGLEAAAQRAVDKFQDRLHKLGHPRNMTLDQYLAERARARPTIVCLCGSTRFSAAFRQANLQETLAGKIVLSIGCDMRSDIEIFANMAPEELDQVKTGLDELHKRKIDLADEVLILNVGGYIGHSTRSELEYAIAHGKTVRYLEPLLEATPHDHP
jgi:NTP pyrophosphatase (non-canonical NTP hydrolase)